MLRLVALSTSVQSFRALLATAFCFSEPVVMKSFINTTKKQLKGGWPEDNTGYKVNVGKYTYYIRISPQRDADGVIREYSMDMGGRKRGCVSIRIPTLHSISRTDPKQAVLKYVQFNPLCSANSDRDLVSGFGTKHMLKTALHFAKELCPNTDIQSFRFMDTSRKLCSDGATVDLPYLMIALFGQTYYEKYYFARLEENDDHEKYKTALQQLNQVPRETMSFDTFVGICILNQHQKQIMQPLYETATTFTSFFQSIRKQYASTVCQVMAGWVNRFIIDWVFSGKDPTSRFWIIPATKIPAIDVENWEVIAVDSVEMNVLNRDQQGGDGNDKGNHYLGLYDPNED